MAVGIRHADHVAPSIRKSCNHFADKRRSLGRCSSLSDSDHGGIFFIFTVSRSYYTKFSHFSFNLFAISLPIKYEQRNFDWSRMILKVQKTKWGFSSNSSTEDAKEQPEISAYTSVQVPTSQNAISKSIFFILRFLIAWRVEYINDALWENRVKQHLA
jgi:hypothetical protein